MAVEFKELGKSKVHIGIAGGKYIEVSLLPISDVAKVNALQQELAKLNAREGITDGERIEAIIGARREMAAIVSSVIPEELRDSVTRMDMASLTVLAGVLCTGKDDSEDDDPSKKVTYPSQAAEG